ncbi:hypothetical protein RDWZM_002284 [Blomia tropicalis]|uniref:Uncharacterized protein n=1 Tax=Blomia tropicalis TaxID=40697 RepID=A0A9Q0MDL6_BLOTA|nr:hypothetical protein BLOT_002014 [Blomia tropicalis]KAJ6223739.1 hypothetical protein RDWZM_002284 [Blomia tropicalis]
MVQFIKQLVLVALFVGAAMAQNDTLVLNENNYGDLHVEPQILEAIQLTDEVIKQYRNLPMSQSRITTKLEFLPNATLIDNKLLRLKDIHLNQNFNLMKQLDSFRVSYVANHVAHQATVKFDAVDHYLSKKIHKQYASFDMLKFFKVAFYYDLAINDLFGEKPIRDITVTSVESDLDSIELYNFKLISYFEARGIAYHHLLKLESNNYLKQKITEALDHEIGKIRFVKNDKSDNKVYF